MEYPKWRETCDSYCLPYHHFQLLEVLGYPHAGNDVFHVQGLLNGHKCTAYLKVQRQPDAAIRHEADILPQIQGLPVPTVLDGAEAFLPLW